MRKGHDQHTEALALELMLDSEEIELDEPFIPEKALPIMILAVALAQIFGIAGILSSYIH